MTRYMTDENYFEVLGRFTKVLGVYRRKDVGDSACAFLARRSSVDECKF